MYAVVLAAGEGKRMSSFCKGISKCILKLGETSILQMKVEKLAQCTEVSEIIIVIRQDEEDIQKEIGQCYHNKRIVYCKQNKSKYGLVQAAYTPKSILEKKKEKILFCLGDEYYRNFDYGQLLKFHNEQNSMFTACIAPTQIEEKIKNNYTLKLDEEWSVLDAEEKPDQVMSNYIGCGTFIMEYSIYEALDIKLKSNYHDSTIVDWIKLAMSNKLICKGFVYEDLYQNINTFYDYIYLKALYNIVDVRECYGDKKLKIVVNDADDTLINCVRNNLLEYMPEYEIPDLEVVYRGRNNKKEFNINMTVLELKISKVFCRLLKKNYVDSDENFFEAGGNYTMAKALVTMVRNETRREIPASLILINNPTIANIARNIYLYEIDY